MPELPETTGKGLKPNLPDDRQELIVSIVGASILLFAAAAIIIYLGVRGTGPEGDSTPTLPAIVEATSTSPSSPLPTPKCQTVINSDNVQVSVAIPLSTTIKGTSFHIEPTVLQEDRLGSPSGQADVALWVCGTVVNYVIALEPTPETEALMTSLAPGDTIQLRLDNGTILPFRFSERKEVPSGDEDVLAQRQPRVTILLPRGDTWQVITADYVADEETTGIARPEPSAQLGQPVRVGDAQVTVIRGHATHNEDLPSGTMYYLVEFSVDNVGDTALSTASFSMRLQDSLGNTYLTSPSASQAGEYGPLSGEIAPGALTQATAGYLVPQRLPAGVLTWIFSPRPGSDARARIGIPHQGTADGPSAEQVDVTLSDAFLSADGDELIIVGEVHNDGPEPIIVESDDLIVSSTAGTSQLVVAAPPLPWSIEPGQTQMIELQYQRPEASAALLEILGYSFEIAGLQ